MPSYIALHLFLTLSYSTQLISQTSCYRYLSKAPTPTRWASNRLILRNKSRWASNRLTLRNKQSQIIMAKRRIQSVTFKPIVTPWFSEPGWTGRSDRIPRTGESRTEFVSSQEPPIQLKVIRDLDSWGGNSRTQWYNKYQTIKRTESSLYVIGLMTPKTPFHHYKLRKYKTIK